MSRSCVEALSNSGAGFRHNRGGWLAAEAFEYLLGDSVVIANPDMRDLLGKYQPKGGFEAVLGEIQRHPGIPAGIPREVGI